MILTYSNLIDNIEPIKDKLPNDILTDNYEILKTFITKFKGRTSGVMDQHLDFLNKYCNKNNLLQETRQTEPQFKQSLQIGTKAVQEEYISQIKDIKFVPKDSHKTAVETIYIHFNNNIPPGEISRVDIVSIASICPLSESTILTITRQVQAFEQAKEVCLNMQNE